MCSSSYYSYADYCEDAVKSQSYEIYMSEDNYKTYYLCTYDADDANHIKIKSSIQRDSKIYNRFELMDFDE